MVILCGAQIASMVFGLSIEGSSFILFVIAPYIAIALGAGWFSEVRRYAGEQKQAADELRRLETALETMQIGVSITDLDGRIVYTNPAEASMHGFTVDELINQDIGVYAPPGTRKPLTRDQLSELKSRNRETTNVRRDGSVFPVHLRSDVVENASGEVLGVVTTCEDITERKQTEDRLRGSLEQLRAAQLQVIQAEKLESIGRMAAGVAHEVKNPLKPAREAGGLPTPDRLTDEPLDRRQLCALLGRGQRDRITALSGFGRRCIPSGGVARRSNAAGLSPRAATGRYPIFPPTAVATFCPSSAAETIPPA